MAIKKQPDDFIVEEAMAPAWTAAISPKLGPVAVYELRKRSLATPEAVNALGRRLKVPSDAIAYAGLKDKHAQTVQQVTVRAGFKRAAQLPPIIQADNWRAQRLGYCQEPITSKAIAANRFTITIRTLTRRNIDDLRQRAGKLALDPTGTKLLCVNYFGDQRFGSARGGEFVARMLIRGQFEQAMRHLIAVHHRKDTMPVKQFKRAVQEHWGDWQRILARNPPHVPEMRALRHLARNPTDFAGAFSQLPYFQQQMTIEAYQSLLWNRIAVKFIAQASGPDAPLLHTPDKFGHMLFPPAALIPAEDHAMDLPLLGKNQELLEPWRDAAETVLKEENLATADLRIPGLQRPWFGSAPRTLFMIADEFHIAPPEVDELQPKAKRFKLRVSFLLPRGSYATVMLRALGN